jgi:hypothetical protein
VRADVTRGAGNENGLHESTFMSLWLPLLLTVAVFSENLEL